MVRSTQAQADFLDREKRIIDSARAIAEAEGWPAVTVRRLAAEIGFSQPILYRHFPRGREEIVERVVLDGFARLARAMETAARSGDRLRATAEAYLRFAQRSPAVYEAMFTALTGIAFASETTPQVLRDAFEPIRRSVARPDSDDEDATTVRAELLWSILHGMSQLARSGRLPQHLERARLDGAVALFRARV